MKKITTLLLLIIPGASYAQSPAEQLLKAQKSVDAGNYADAYTICKEIEPKCDKKDTLYSEILWYYTTAATLQEKQERSKENWSGALTYGLAALQVIEKGEPYFDERYKARKYWMYKNVIVSYFGLRQLDDAKKYQEKLYAAYKEKKLPEGINQYYNFEFFKWDGKNIWGYEYYPELGDPETEGSFSKIVYYVYSTNPDGSDKDQLYRLHVLKFHKFDDSVKFDYVLTKRLQEAKNEVSGTLYDYTYVKKLDYTKVMADIREVLKGNYTPNTKSTIKTE